MRIQTLHATVKVAAGQYDGTRLLRQLRKDVSGCRAFTGTAQAPFRMQGLFGGQFARLHGFSRKKPGDGMHQSGGDAQRFAGKLHPLDRAKRLAIRLAVLVEIRTRLVGQHHRLGIEAGHQLVRQLQVVSAHQRFHRIWVIFVHMPP